jgi:hypothetical protein
MQVNTLPAGAGLTWLRQGIALLRRQAFAFTALVIMYSMALMLLANVPFIGPALAAMLVPFGTLGITAAGRDAERNVMPMPSLLIDGIRRAQERTALLKLGMINAVLILLLIVVASLAARDELARWSIVDGQIDPVSVAANVPWDALGLAFVLYLPVLMLTWFSPQLVAWHKLPVGKAMFFSFFACWRNRGPFLVLGLLLAGLFVTVSWLASQLLAAFGAPPQLASILYAPIALLLTSVAYSTQYPIYRSVLQADAPAAAPRIES